MKLGKALRHTHQLKSQGRRSSGPTGTHPEEKLQRAPKGAPKWTGNIRDKTATKERDESLCGGTEEEALVKRK